MALKVETVSVADLDGGSVIPKLDEALRKVGENILDPDTSATGVREIVLKIKLKPDDKRDLAVVDIGVNVKTQAPKPTKTRVFLGQRSDGTVVISNSDQKQADLFMEEAAKILPLPAPSAPTSIETARVEKTGLDPEDKIPGMKPVG